MQHKEEHERKPCVLDVRLCSVPETWKCLMLPLLPSSTVDSCTTDIWFVVSVPVLSLQMTVVHPRVSTEGSFL